METKFELSLEERGRIWIEVGEEDKGQCNEACRKKSHVGHSFFSESLLNDYSVPGMGLRSWGTKGNLGNRDCSPLFPKR